MAPRAFVVWFLSMLTLVATTVIRRLTFLDETAHNIERQAVDTKKLVYEAATEFKALNERAVHVTTETNRVFNLQVSSLGIIGQIERIRRAAGETDIGLNSLLRGVAARAEATARAAEALCTRAASAKVGQLISADIAGTAGLVFHEVLYWAVADYLGVDPLTSAASSEGLAYTLEGDYLLYSRLIENLFSRIMLIRDKIMATQYRIEIFTTLNVPPRMWYNVIIPVGWKDDLPRWIKDKRRFWDSSVSTNLRWERYRAVQAACIDLGKNDDFCGFTRCFLREGRLDAKESGPLYDRAFEFDRNSFVPTPCLAARDQLVATLKACGGVCDEDELRRIMQPLQGAEACKLVADYEGVPPSPGDEGTRGDYVYPIVYDADHALSDPAPEGFSGLISDLVHKYQTSPERSLLWSVKRAAAQLLPVSISPIVDPKKPILPWDLFAVGLTKKDSDISALPGGEGDSAPTWLFTVSLITDERGGQTTTRVLPCIDDADQNRLDFQAYTGFVNLILKHAADKDNTLKVSLLSEE